MKRCQSSSEVFLIKEMMEKLVVYDYYWMIKSFHVVFSISSFELFPDIDPFIKQP
jgi:hypothetical protein